MGVAVPDCRTRRRRHCGESIVEEATLHWEYAGRSAAFGGCADDSSRDPDLQTNR